MQKPLEKQEIVRPPKIFKELPHEVRLVKGQPLNLNCIVDGLPTPQINWLRNNQPIPTSERVSINFNPSTGLCVLNINEVDIDDSGLYKLIAENIGGRADTEGYVYVKPVEQKLQPIKAVEEHIAPKFLVNLPAKLKVQEGEPIRLSCQVDGVPKPSVNWLKDGKNLITKHMTSYFNFCFLGNALPASLRFATDFSSPTGQANLIVNSTLLTDCGNYTAVAENPQGKAYSSSQVFIKEASAFDTGPFSKLDQPKQYGQDAPYDSFPDDDVPLNRAKPPKVIQPLQNLKHVEGEPINMGCKIDGYPRPRLTWLKDGRPLPASNRYFFRFNLKNNFYLFSFFLTQIYHHV